MKLLQLNEAKYAGNLPKELVLTVPVRIPIKSVRWMVEEQVERLIENRDAPEDDEMSTTQYKKWYRKTTKAITNRLMQDDEIKAMLNQIVLNYVNEQLEYITVIDKDYENFENMIDRIGQKYIEI